MISIMFIIFKNGNIVAKDNMQDLLSSNHKAITNNFVIGAPKKSNFQGKNIIKSLKVIQNLCDQI
jgi:hypothetical protein